MNDPAILAFASLEYQQMFSMSMAQAIKDDTSGDYQKLLLQLLPTTEELASLSRPTTLAQLPDSGTTKSTQPSKKAEPKPESTIMPEETKLIPKTENSAPVKQEEVTESTPASIFYRIIKQPGFLLGRSAFNI